MQSAACRHADNALFFPGKGGRIAIENSRRARRLCQGCAVLPECLDYALVTFGSTTDYGIWGNTNVQERRDLRRQLVEAVA